MKRAHFRTSIGKADALLKGRPGTTALRRRPRIGPSRGDRPFLLLFSLLLAASLAVDAQAQVADTPATNAPPAVTPASSDTPPVLDAAPPPTAPSVAPTGRVQTPKRDDIEDIRPPFFYLHAWFWWWMAIASVVVLGLLVLMFFWLKPGRQLSAKSAYELTLEKLEKARALLREDNARPYAIAVSEAVRGYLGQRFQTPSTRRTTEEFLRLMENDEGTPLSAHRDLLRNFLGSCDLVKFARYQPTLDELEEVHQRAFTFVMATRPLPGPENGRRP